MTCSVEEIHVGDIGTVFDVPLLECDAPAEDIQQATVKKILFARPRPDADVLIVDAEFATDGTDGVLRYVAQDGDLDRKGKWKIQARVELPSGEWSSDIECFTVYKNLDTV